MEKEKKYIMKAKEISILEELRDSYSYFSKEFSDSDINQMISNIRNDFPLLMSVDKINRLGIPCMSTATSTYLPGINGRITKAFEQGKNEFKHIRVSVYWYHLDGSNSSSWQRLQDVMIIPNEEWENKFREKKEKYMQLKQEKNELWKDKVVNSKRISEITNEMNEIR